MKQFKLLEYKGEGGKKWKGMRVGWTHKRDSKGL
jgi:hypothetical protein